MSSVFQIAEEKKQRSPSTEGKHSSSVFDIAKEKGFATTSEKSSLPAEENFLQKTARGAARTALDVGEVIGGLPGNTFSLANDFIAAPLAEKVTGKKASPYENLPISKVLPTSQMLQSKRPDYLKPRSEKEAAWSEFVQDVTGLALPFSGSKTKSAVKSLDFFKRMGKRLAKSLGIGGAGVASKELAKTLGVDEETANKIKMGVVFAGSLGTEGIGAEKYKNSLYQKMRELRNPSSSLKSRDLLSNARKMKIDLQKGGKSASSTKSLEKVDEIISKINKGKGSIAIEELEEFGKKINEAKGSLYDEFGANKIGRKTAARNLDRVSALVESGIEEYGKTNPKYYEARKLAQEAHGAIESSRKVSNFLKKHVSGISKGGAMGLLVEALTKPSALVPTVGIGGASIAGLKGSEVVARIIKSPVLREYYLNVLEGAAKRNSSFMLHNLNKLSKKIEEDPNLLLED